MSSSSEYDVGGLITISCCHRSKIERYKHRFISELSTILGELNNFISKLCDIRGLKFYDIVLYEIRKKNLQLLIRNINYFLVFAAAVYRFYSLERDKHL